MFQSVTTAAWTVDAWLKEHLGRPYTVMLTIGLVAAISANIQGIETKIQHGAGLTSVALNVVFDAILLVNQLAQLHEYRSAARERRAARKAERTGTPGKSER